MGRIFYLIPDIHKKEFSFKGLMKAILSRNVIGYFQHKVFRKHKPVGGVKVMYQHCMLLQEIGYQAYPLIMGDYGGNFFGYKVEIMHLQDVGYDLSKEDIIVSPEFLPYLGLRFKNCVKVFFNQSQNWRHYDNSLKEKDRGKDYFELGYDYVINCSEHLCKMLKLKMNVNSTAITNGIDKKKFFPMPEKRIAGRVLALSRKHPEQIQKIIKGTKNLNFEFCVVDGLTQKQLVEEYQKADIFLATGYPEGLPLPQLEAMNCGCVVIGFSGGGGDEYMIDRQTSMVAEDGDCEGVVTILKLLESDLNLKEEIREGGYKKATKYTLDNTKKMLNYFYSCVVVKSANSQRSDVISLGEKLL